MSRPVPPWRRLAAAVFDLLDPIPFGCFVAALVFDITYARSAEMLWTKAAAWLITIGLLAAVVPRVLNLVLVWGSTRRGVPARVRVDSLLNVLAIVVAVFNALIHTRDAYAVVPAAQWLSALTVALIGLGRIVASPTAARLGDARHG